jgi:hypothetical protein
VRHGQYRIVVRRRHPHDEVVSNRATDHVAVEQEADSAEHSALGDTAPVCKTLGDALDKLWIADHNSLGILDSQLPVC